MGRNGWRGNLLVSAASLVVFFGVVETIARIHYRGRFPYPLVFDEHRLWRQRPHWEGEHRGGVRVAFNSLGLRESREFTGAKPAQRILVLGDSIAFGYALEQDETISHRMEERWNPAHPRQIEVINAGVPGYATQQETVLLRELAPILEPDLVLLFFCTNNDIWAEGIEENLERRGMMNPGQKKLAVRNDVLEALIERSAFAYALARSYDRWRTRLHERWGRVEGERRLRFADLRDFAEHRDQHDRVYEILATRLGAFGRLAESFSAEKVLVLFPVQDHVDGTLSTEPIDRIADLARRAGFRVLDLLPHFRAAGRPVLRARDGTHPTAAGATLTADVILRFLEDEGLVAAGPGS